MQILKKYKKLFDEGFKDFVMNLDLLPTKVVREIVFNALLEDPVYLKWAIENKLNFEYFINLNKADVLKIFRTLSNSEALFLRALKNHPDEEKFISNNLPSLILKQYLADRESNKITVSQQEDARSKIMKTIFELKEKGDLEPFDWKMPPVEVLKGNSHNIDSFGVYTQNYNDGILALTGAMVSGKRSGLWKNFYPNGALQAEGNYIEGQKQDEWSFFFSNGSIKSKGRFKNDLKQGEWLEFDLNSEVKITNYKNGKTSI